MPPRDEPSSYGEYEIEKLLGKGSIGKVYLARHRRIGRRVALKIIRPEQRFDDEADRAEFHKRLQREAELCAALQHPNVVTLFEAGYEDDVVAYLATEYVEGESLQSRLKKTRPLPRAEALSIAADVLRALAYAHGKGVIHRDIKPGNILIATGGEAKIADFGIARPVNSSLTGINSLLGTPNYMSPEQVKSSSITPRADLFSAGVVMYEMLTGVKPFGAADISGILYNVVNLEPAPADKLNPNVPRAVSKIVAKLLAKSPPARYGTAAEALAEVERARGPVAPPVGLGTLVASKHDEATTPLNPADAPTHVSLMRRRVPAAMFWAVTLLLLAGFGGSWFWLRSRVGAVQPATEISLEQLARFEAKRLELAAARASAAAGRYEEAVHRYNVYLAKYPDSPAALAEREAARHKLIVDMPIVEEITVTKPRPKPQQQQAAPPKPASRWERMKRWLRSE
ncbi:MAG: serine/threonine-protein kinase [Acidobacteriota bacterium]